MATNVYVITSVVQLGDQLTVSGTVNGTNVAVITSARAAGSAMATAAGFQAFIQPLMDAAIPPQPVQHPKLVQTFTA